MSGKLTKYNLNKQKEMERQVEPNSWVGKFGKKIQDFSDGELYQVINGTYPEPKPKLDHPYNQRFWVKIDYEIRPFLYFFTRKVKVGEQNIPTLLCNTCGLPQENHYI